MVTVQPIPNSMQFFINLFLLMFSYDIKVLTDSGFFIFYIVIN